MSIDSAFLSSVDTAIKRVVSHQTLVELTNQRRVDKVEEKWDNATSYAAGSIVEHNDIVWEAQTSALPGQEPGVHAAWKKFVLEIEQDTLNEVVKMEAAFLQEQIGTLVAESPLDVKFTVELALQSLAGRVGMKVSDIGIQAREATMREIDLIRRVRLASRGGTKVTPLKTGALSDEHDPWKREAE